MDETEDFENNNAANGADVIGFSGGAPLVYGVPLLDGAGIGFENGLASTSFQLLSGGPANQNLALVASGTFGISTDAVGSLDFMDSTVIDVLESARAIGFDLFQSDPFGINNGNYQLDVFDEDGVSILSTSLLGLGDETYFGVVADPGDSIGSISINGLEFAQLGGEFIDNVQVWQAIPEPSAAAFALSGLFAVISRRSRR